MTEEMLRLLAAQRREKENLLLCIDRAWKDCARQARQARRRLRRLEGVLALTTQEIKLQPDAAAPASEDKSDETQLESLNRRLAAAQQELRQYETRLFACDRTILALKKENAELSALCDKARAQGFIPEEEEEPQSLVWPDGLGTGPQRPAPPGRPARRRAGRARLAGFPHGTAGTRRNPGRPSSPRSRRSRLPVLRLRMPAPRPGSRRSPLSGARWT